MKKHLSTVRGPLPAGIKLDENVYVTMRDGVMIAVDVYRPEAEGRYPALFSMSPYMKEIQHQPPMLTHSIEAGATGFYVPKGYVHVIAQVRGSGYSQGRYNFLDAAEQQDGYDLVEWVARQSWCDGNVGMIGDSYFAMIQFMVAAQQPPHLKCIAPFDGCSDIYRDFAYQGGIFFAWFIGMWGPDTIRQAVWPGPIEGKLMPANFIGDLAANPEDGPYYWERSAYTKADEMKVPMLSMVAHQGFLHSRGQLALYPMVKSPKKLLVVPPSGIHQHEFFLLSKPLNEYMLRWYDYWLKGIDTGIMNEPEVAIFDDATQEWRHENEYPLARTAWKKYYLRSNPAGPANEPPYGRLGLEPAESEEPDAYRLPDSIGLVAEGRPVLAYRTPPLDEDIRVWGPLSIIMYGSFTTLDMEWFVKVADIHPDDRIAQLTYGHLKASYRKVDESMSESGQPFHPFREPEQLEPNKVYEYKIEMMPIFHTFKAGHKISVQIASEDFWYREHLRTVNISQMLPLPATNTIFHEAKYPSLLLLPTIPDAPLIKPVEPPLSHVKWPL
jgi:uncharacterized protein